MPFILNLIFIFLFGLIIGSFLNCLIWRLHEKESLGGRSRCPKCKKQISWHDNIPLLSFILLRGKCRNCGQSISWQYPIVELITGVLFAMAFLHNLEFRILNFESIFNYSIINDLIKIQNSKFIIQLFRDWFFIAVMIIVFIYDLRWYLILDIVTLPAGAVMLILNLVLGFDLWNMLFSGIIGGGFFLLQYLISQGRWIGGGDIRLGLLLGLALGWPAILLVIIISYFIGSAAGIALIIVGKKKWGSEVPLGVFLALGGVISLFWGERMLNWYFDLL